jgi:hypothetical protein
VVRVNVLLSARWIQGPGSVFTRDRITHVRPGPRIIARDQFSPYVTQDLMAKLFCRVRCSPCFGPKDSVYKVDRCLSKD